MGLIFVFLDGVGLGMEGPQNPLSQYPSPRLTRILGGPLLQSSAQESERLLLRALDACLGVPGLPQSATGQTTLFTGVNAAQYIGGHLSAYPSPRLRQVIAEHSLLRRAAERGHRATFANAYSAQYWEKAETGKARHSASTLTNQAAGLRFRDEADVVAGEAVFWDITHQFTRHWLPTVRVWTPSDGAQVLLRLAESYDLVMYESFLTDLVGHRRLPISDEEVVSILDEFLGTLVAGLGTTDTLIMTSDHGNFEDTIKKIHTLNPVPLLAVGADSRVFADLGSIADVAGAILDLLEDRRARELSAAPLHEQRERRGT